MTPHLHSSVAGAHHAGTSRMHLGQVVKGQDVAALWGQVEEFKCLLVITLYSDAIWGTSGKKKSTQLPGRATVLQPLASEADECEML